MSAARDLSWVNQDETLEAATPLELGYLMTVWSWFDRDAKRVSMPPTVLVQLFPGDRHRGRVVAELVRKGLLGKGAAGHLVETYRPVQDPSRRQPGANQAPAFVETTCDSPAQELLLRSVICDSLSSSSSKKKFGARPVRKAREQKPRERTPQSQAFERVEAAVAKAYNAIDKPPPLRCSGLYGKVAAWAVQHGITDEQLHSSLSGFLKDPYWAERGHPIHGWARDPARYVPQQRSAYAPYVPNVYNGVVV